MKFETRIRRTPLGLYYPEYRKVYWRGFLKTPWFNLYSQTPNGDVTRCWSSLHQAKDACQKLLDTGKLTCTEDTFIYP